MGAVTWCVVSTYTIFSHTVDEPTHIAAGMEWLERGTQELHSENPPLPAWRSGWGPTWPVTASDPRAESSASASRPSTRTAPTCAT